MNNSVKKLTALLAAAVIVCSTLSGCSTPTTKKSASTAGSTATSSTAATKNLRYNISSELDSLDPQMSNSADSATVCYHLFDGLMRNNNGKIEPGAATDYKVSSDGLTYTFHLRKDGKWSDGQNVTAKDFEYAWKRLVDPATASPYAYFGAVVKNGADITSGKKKPEELGVKCTDDYTFVVTLETPAAYFPYMLSAASFAPTREDLVKKYSKDFAAAPEKNVYNGPFVIQKWEHGNKLTLAKNEKYWNAAKVKLDTAEITVIADSNTALAMYNQGQLDMVTLPTTMVAQYKDKAKSYFTGADDYLMLNQASKKNNGAMGNKNFRMALNYAVNRDEYNKLANAGVYKSNTRYVLPQVAGSSSDKTYGEEFAYEAFPATNDEAKAKEYLDKALSELGFSNASEINVELLVSDTDVAKKQSEVLQSQLQKNLGIKVTIKQVQYKQHLAMDNKSDFEISFAGWMPDYSDPETYLNMWEAKSAYNHVSYKSNTFDQYMDAAAKETDAKKRMEDLFNAEKTMCEDGVVVPLQLRQDYMLLNDKVKDFQTYFVGYTKNFIYADIES